MTNINEIPVTDNAIISTERATVGMLRHAIEGLSDDAQIVIPLTVFGIELDQLEVGAILLNDDKSVVGIVAVSSFEFENPDKENPLGTEKAEADTEQEQPFA